MDELKQAICDILWIDYGNIEGFMPDEGVTAMNILTIKAACDLALAELNKPKEDN